MPTSQKISLGLRSEKADLGDHIAYFWESDKEFDEGVRFIEVGLDEGDFCVLFGHHEANARVQDVLTRRGYDCARLEAGGRLTIVPGGPSGDAMLAHIGDVFGAAVAGGAKILRLLGNIGWGRSGWPNEKDILAFEAKVTGAAKHFPCVVVCMYDVRSLPGRVMVHGAFETHPLTICGNVMRQNTHYVEVDEFLRRLETDEKPD